MPDFALMQTPNFATAALGGYTAGLAMGKQKRTQAALDAYAQDPEKGIAALDSVDPALSQQLRENRDKTIEQRAVSAVFAPALGGTQPVEPQGGVMQVSAPDGAQPPAAPPVAPQRADGLQINQAALTHLWTIAPDKAQQLTQFLATADKTKVEAFKAHAEVKGQLAMYLKTLPPAQRAAAYQRAMPELLQRGFVPQASEGMNFDDAALDQDVAFAVPTVEAIKQARDDRKEAAANADRVTDNKRADAGLGIRRDALELAKGKASKGGAAPGADMAGLSTEALIALATGGN